MAKVEMNGFTVTNVEPCPKCGATEYASINEVWKMFQIVCDRCDYVADGALLLQKPCDINKDREGFIEVTRSLFNMWNKGVANETETKVKRVRILNKKENL